MCRLKNIPLNNYWVTVEIKEEIKRYLDIFENKTTNIQNLLYTDLRDKFIKYKPTTETGKKKKKVTNEQPNLTPEKIRITNKTQSKRGK